MAVRTRCVPASASIYVYTLLDFRSLLHSTPHFLLLRLLLQIALRLIHDSFALLSDISYAYAGHHNLDEIRSRQQMKKQYATIWPAARVVFVATLLLLLLLRQQQMEVGFDVFDSSLINGSDENSTMRDAERVLTLAPQIKTVVLHSVLIFKHSCFSAWG